MAVDALHPDYEVRQEDWEMVRDGLEGERIVKSRRGRYLPPPPGMPISGNEVLAATGKRTLNQPYDFYLSFAEFPEIIEPALTGFQGMIHARDPRVNLPQKMKYLEEDATPEGNDLTVLWSMVTREILSGGRVGLLADVGKDDLVRIVAYSVENVTNWQERAVRFGGGALFVVIRELRDTPVMHGEEGNEKEDEFRTEKKRFWRELRLNLRNPDDPSDSTYQARLWKEPEKARTESTTSTITPAISAGGSQGTPEPVENDDGEEWTTPNIRGKPFDFIPFLPINAIDIGFEYGVVPILPMTRRAFSIYRLTADYRRALYMKGDPQAYVAGIEKEEAPTKIGGGAVWTFTNPDAKPGYLDIEGQGIPHMRTAIQDELTRFDQEGGRLLSTTQRPESGDALKQRLMAHQVTIRNIVINAGMGMEIMLKGVAEMLGLNSDQVSFEPDLDFASPILTGADAGEWAKAQKLGFPVSSQTLHSLARRGGVTEKSFEEEVSEIEDDAMSLASIPGPSDQVPPGEEVPPGETPPGEKPPAGAGSQKRDGDTGQKEEEEEKGAAAA